MMFVGPVSGENYRVKNDGDKEKIMNGMHRVVCLLATAVMLTSFSGYGELNSVEDVLAWAQSETEALESWAADVTQTTPMGFMTMTTSGEAMGKGNLFRSVLTMEFLGQKMTNTTIRDADRVQWVIAEGDGMSHRVRLDMARVAEAAQEIDSDIDSAFFESSAMGGRFDNLLKELQEEVPFTLSGSEEINGEPVYLLEGKLPNEVDEELVEDMEGTPDRIVIAISQDDAFPRRFTLFMEDDSEGVSMEFTNVRINPELDDELFTYAPAEGEEVVDNTDDLIAMLRGETPDLPGMASEDGEGQLGAGDEAPKFEAPMLDGETLALEDYQGKPVLLDFWATWCGPCRAKMPDLIDLYQEYQDKGLVVIGISLDNERSDLEEYLAENSEMTWPQVFDGQGWRSEVAQQYGVSAIPHLVLVDPDGMVRGQYMIGPALREAIEEYIE